MKIKFHHLLAFFILTLFIDWDLELSFVRLRIIDVYLVVLIALMILSGSYIRIKNNTATLTFYLFIIYLLLNGVLKVSLSSIIKEIIQLIEYLFIMQLIANATVEAKKREEFLNVLLIGTGCIALFSMLYSVSHGAYANYKDLDAPKHSFAFFALLAFIKLFTNKDKNQNILAQLGVVFLAVIMLLLSGERKGWAAFILGAGIFTLLQSKSKLSRRTVSAIVAFFVVAIMMGTMGVLYVTTWREFSYINRQFASLTDVTNIFSGGGSQYASRSDEERIFMLHYGLHLFTQYPVSGIGIDQFRTYIFSATGGEFAHDAHNFYLKVLVEDGIVGLILYLLPLFIIFVELWKLNRTGVPHIAKDARIVIALFILGCVVNLFLAGKALSWLYVILPCGLLLGLRKELSIYKNK